MAEATGFRFNKTTGNVEMNAGDTGAFIVNCTRKSGESWPDTARMLFTITSPSGEIVLQRIYRMDDQYDLGDGKVLIEFHNDDTDTWDVGTYTMERRYNILPQWAGTPSEARCVNALAPGAARMIEGVPVRTVFVGTLRIDGVQGRI